MVKRSLLCAAAIAVAAATPAFATCDDILPPRQFKQGAVRGIVARDLIELRDIGDDLGSPTTDPSPLSFSPDGRAIAFVLSKADIATNSYCRALVVMPVAGGAPRVVDQGGEFIVSSDIVRGLLRPTGGSDTDVPAWSPDGRWLAYRKRIGGLTQIWRVRADGQGAEQITESTTDITRFTWVTNGAIVYATRPGIVAAEAANDAEKLTGYLYDDRVVPFVGPRPLLRADDVPEAFFVADFPGPVRPASNEEARLLPPQHYGFDTTSIVLTSRTGWRAGTERMSANPLAQRRLWVTSPDGKRVICSAACDGGIDQWWWTEDGVLLFRRREGWARGQSAIYRWLPGNGQPKRIAGGPEWLLGCTYRARQLFCTSETSTTPRRLVAIDAVTGKTSMLFDPNPSFARLRLGKVERIPTTNDVGLDAWSDLVLPPDYRPGQRLPLVVVQYRSDGFLRGGIGDDYPIFLLAQRGFAVLSVARPPVVGSNRPELDSYDKVISEMTKDWAERKSILSSLLVAVDKVVARGLVDPDRVGITGLSDGISTTEYALINTRRFAAAAISSCCEDPKTLMTYGGTRWADWNRAVRGYPLASEDGRPFWKKMSFAVNARYLDTPILMQLADREYLGGLEAYTALREQKNPVELYVFDDEYHVKWQPRHRLAIYERDIDWFAFWLSGSIDDDPAKRDQYQRWKAMRAARPAVRLTKPPADLAD